MKTKREILRLATGMCPCLAEHTRYIKAKTLKEQKIILAENIIWLVNSGIFTHEEAIKLLSTKTLQLAAVKQHGRAIQCIDKPSEKVQLAAVKQARHAIECISDPSERVVEYWRSRE